MPLQHRSARRWSLRLLPREALKQVLHEQHTALVKLLSILATFDTPASVTSIKERSQDAGFRIPRTWNVSSILARSKGMAIRTRNGWELHLKGQTCLETAGIVAAIEKQSLSSLSQLVDKVADANLKSFLHEVVRAYEAKLYRSAIVMSWLSAMYILQLDMLENYLPEFNSEMLRINSSFKKITRIDQLGPIKESEQLIRMCAIGMFSPAVKKELEGCLDRRNSCGHPTAITYGSATVEHHIEVLLNNVILSRAK